MEENCLFCKIIKGEIPCTKVYEDEYVFAFKDINPLAKIHYLFIPKVHSKNVLELTANNPELLAKINLAMTKIVADENLEENGFRIVTNINRHGGQTVFHTHFHLLAGEQLKGFGA